MIEILDVWSVIDRWWTDTPQKREFAEVLWGDRKLIFMRELPDKVWRIRKSGA
jgi:hypothetical protein